MSAELESDLQPMDEGFDTEGVTYAWGDDDGQQQQQHGSTFHKSVARLRVVAIPGLLPPFRLPLP